jgi:hypothetical protein
MKGLVFLRSGNWRLIEFQQAWTIAFFLSSMILVYDHATADEKGYGISGQDIGKDGDALF